MGFKTYVTSVGHLGCPKQAQKQRREEGKEREGNWKAVGADNRNKNKRGKVRGRRRTEEEGMRDEHFSIPAKGRFGGQSILFIFLLG